jgi:glycosyltransferase involved in cell wall biosynthesis
MTNFAVVIPAYNEAHTIRDIAQRTLAYCQQVIVVDDGSTDNTVATLEGLPVTILRNQTNQGKGASLWQGMQAAMGVSFIITLDADGQHLPEDIPQFLAMQQSYPEHIIIGSRLADKSAIPTKRYYANKVANFWISWAAGYIITDSQSGFRLYPASLLKKLEFKNLDKSKSFVFESEILIKAAQLGVSSVPISIAAVYAENARPSHFRPVWDIVQITRMVAWQLISRGLYLQGLFKQWRLNTIGMDGLAMLLLSNIVILATGGISLIVTAAGVYRVAQHMPRQAASGGCYMVLGMRLNQGKLSPDYVLRLNTAQAMFTPDSRILILGGKTSPFAQSEAQAGQAYLIAQGVPADNILIEDQSRHTLENLQQAKRLLAENEQVILITNRYHLARSHAFAKGFSIAHSLCAAEPRLVLNLRTLFKMMQESYLLHWYEVGKVWARWTANKKMLKRIS